MTAAAIKTTNNNTKAIEAVKARFIRMPFRPNQFQDTFTGTVMADPAILCDYYHKSGGGFNEFEPAYLLACLDWVYGDAFQPSGPAILPGGLLNTWKPHKFGYSGCKVNESEVQPFLEYMERMFPIEAERHYMHWWIAHAIRRPNQKMVATPVLRSRQGIGKTFLVGNLMRGIMGPSAAVCTLSDIVGTFQDVLIGKTTLLIDECYIDKRRTTNVLKMYQSNDHLTINRKNIPQTEIENKINFIIASNDFDPVYFESSDRRFFIPQFIEYKVSQAESKAFIARFAHWLSDQNGYQLVRDFIEHFNLDDYNAYDPALMTDSKQDRLGWSLEDKIAEQVERLIDGVFVVNVAHIKSHLDIESQQPISDRKVAAVLEQVGCKSKRTDTGVLHITPQGLDAGLSKDTQAKVLKDWLKKTAATHVKF